MRGVRRVRATVTAVALVMMSAMVFAAPVAPAYAISVAPVGLGAAEPFAILAGDSVGNTLTGPATIVRGDVGVVAVAGAVTGFPPGEVHGTLYASGAAPVVNAHADLVAAYAEAAGRPSDFPLLGDSIGLTLLPGVYTTAGAVTDTGTVTLSGGGDPNAVFIFQIGGALSIAAAGKVVLTNGTQAKNVFWQVNGAGAIGADAIFAGTLMTSAAIGVGANTLFNGRALAKTGAVTTNSNQFYSSSPTVSIDPGSTAYSTDTSPTITGTTSVRSPSTVTVTVNGETLTATPSTDGTWSATPAALLANATYAISAAVVDGAGNTGRFSQQLTVDTVLPAISIDGGAAVTTNDTTPTITGIADVAVGQVVSIALTRTSPPSTLNRTALVQADGTWNMTANGLPSGEWTVIATVTDPAGNQNSATQTVSIDVTPPAATISGGLNALTNDSTPTILGTAEAGSIVIVSVDGVALSGVTRNGVDWSVTYASIPLTLGTHNVAMSATDAAGNASSATQVLTVDTVPPVISINPGPADATNDRTPTISGTTDVAPGAIVTVTIGGGPSMPAVVQNDRSWNVTPSAQLAPASYNVIASVSDPANNIGAFAQVLTIDIDSPTVTIDGGPSSSTGDATPSISGSSPDVAVGSPVTVTVAGQTLSTTIGSGGIWAATASTIANGTYVVFVTVTDAAGNTGTNTQSLTVEAVAPAVAINGGAARSTNDASPTIGGSSSAPTGSAVVVTIAMQTLHATVQPGGSWNVTAANLADATATVVASVTDPDGNVGVAQQLLTVDSNAATVIDITGGQARATNDDTPIISGITDAADGRIVTVTVAGQTMTVGAVVGTWSVTATHLSDGIYPVAASVSAADGNPVVDNQSLTIDTVTPVVISPPQNAAADFNSVGPKRVFDTRPGQSPTALRAVSKQQVSGAHELEVQMTDLAGFVPASGVGAVSLNVTSTHSSADGFITVYACGARELVSSVNFAAGRTVANAVVTPVSAAGTVCFFANAPTDIIVDINGWFATGATFTAVGPKRVFDTRAQNSPDALRAVIKAKVASNSMIEVRLTDLAAYVPVDGVTAVSLNVVVTNPQASGFVTVYSCGTRALVSSVNYVAGQTVANAVIAPVSATGTVCFYSLAATDLIVDINGWLHAGSAFHGIDPARVLDTRAGNSPDALRDIPKAKIGGGNILEVRVTDLAGRVPVDGVTAVSLNVTATNPEADGFITVFACGAIEEVSSLNYEVGATVANAVLAPVSATGTICLYSNAPSDVVIDINGWIGSTQAG